MSGFEVLRRVVSRKDVFADTEDELARKREQVREARLTAARSQSKWHEITPAERLCPRGPVQFGWLVDAVDDKVWRVTRGSVFEPGSAMVVANMVSVTFFVDRDGDVIALEPADEIGTWSNLIRKRPDLVTGAVPA